MKRIVTLGVLSVLLAPIALAAGVVAATNTPNQTLTNTQTTVNKTVNGAVDNSLADRIAKRKAALKVVLGAAEKLRIQAKCVAAQTVLGNLKSRLDTAESTRTEAYKQIISDLNDLSTKLKNKSIDTAQFDATITDLQAKIDTYTADLAAYKQDVSDLVAIDCKTDPDGFKVSLQQARTDVQKVNQDAAAVRSQVNDVIKPLLKTIRDQLATNKTGGAN